MPLPTGSRLDSYEILALIGSGGMGEVYRARDTKLNRDVALKILPDAFAADPERLARFTREAQTLAALNHPHIAHIYGLEKQQGHEATSYLVMELVEGEDLAARIRRGAVPLDEALPIARQIADALDAAHEKGIVHRDLKPANIMLTGDGQVKVLDFGLAKAIDPGGPGGTGDQAHSPTITFAGTQMGVILGTAAYMSPEQAKGRVVDKRSDVWAFGCVYYEMLTGRRAFDGEDITETIAAVVRAEPDWSALPRDLPQHIRLLLKRCLEKDRRARVSDIGVARFLMTETLEGSGLQPSASGPRPRWRLVVGASLGLLAVAALLAVAVWFGTTLVPERSPQPTRFTIVPLASQPLSAFGILRDIAISPDGTHIVYRSGLQQAELVVRALDDLAPRTIAGTSAIAPFMSPDGRWIGYFGLNEMRKVSVNGGSSIAICTIGESPRGASWGVDDTITFAVAGTGLISVSAGGGEAKALTVADASQGERGHYFPFILPGGRAVLFTIATPGQTENARDQLQHVAVLDLKTGQRKTLIRGGSDAMYVEPPARSSRPGYLVYATAGTLFGVRFDLTRLEVVGDPVPVLEHVAAQAAGQANAALSRHGTLVYVPGGTAIQSTPLRALVWVNRQGKEEPLKAPPRAYSVARLSPDGTRLALDIRDHTNDIWIWDVVRQTLTPLNLDPGNDMSPVWTSDGKRVIWTSSRSGGNPNLHWQAADGSGVVERLGNSATVQFPTSISPDGTRLMIFGGNSRTGAGALAPTVNLEVFPMDASATPPGAGPRRAEPILQSAAAKGNGEIAPDGRWLAYQSNESGQFQIYVRPFPNVDSGRSQISTNGGTRPAWARNGRELFYLDGNDLLTSVTVQTTPAFRAGNPSRILDTKYYAGSSTRGIDLRSYDVSADGQRFLMVKEAAPAAGAEPPPGIVVVLNWFEELKARVP